jgi:glyoxylase-like metal-dependent hydrolase (beta-lactamase superfamily II)
MLRLGTWNISTVEFGMFRLDGGAMFGSVPKNIWAGVIPADDENCIPLAARGLLIDTGDRRVLVDVGMGDKWNDKQRAIFAIQNTPAAELGLDYSSVTDVILTHLHFDHAGGVSKFEGESLELCFPNAQHYVQSTNYEVAKNPNVRERASYLSENVEPLSKAKLMLLQGDTDIVPGISVHQIDGHTKGQQWIKVSQAGQAVVFPSDLIPTSRHLPVPYVMGYDLDARRSLEEKAAFLEQALKEQWIVVFQHDPDLKACTLATDKRGHYCVGERVDI